MTPDFGSAPEGAELQVGARAGDRGDDLAGDLSRLRARAAELEAEVQRLAEDGGRLGFTHTVVESMGDAAYWASRQGRFVYTNRKASEMLGYSRAELLDLSVWDVDADVTEEGWPAQLRAIEAAGGMVIQARHRRRDGSLVEVEVHVTPVSYQGHLYACGLVRDVTGRLLVERELRASEARFRAIFQGTDEALFVIDPETRQPRMVNEAACRMTGYSAAELTSIPLEALATDPAFAIQTFQTLASKPGQTAADLPVVRKDGSLFFAEGRVSAIELDGRPHALGSLRDVSARHRAEEALAASRASFHAIVETMDHGAVVASTGGRALYANDAARLLLGDDIRLGEALPVSLPDGAAAGEAQVVAGADGRVLEVDVAPTDWHGEPATLAVVRDVTTRARAVEALRALSERNRALLASIPDIVKECDAEGVVVWMNDAGRAFYGEAAVGRRARDLCASPAAADECLERLAARPHEVVESEVVHYRRDGAERIISCRGRALLDAEGRLTGAIFTGRDVTEERHAAEERSRLESDLRQAQKMEALGQLASGVAHDFNNLLHVIEGFTSLALLELPPEAPARSRLDGVEKAVRRAAALARQLLAFGRRSEPSLGPVDLAELVEGLTRMLARVLGERVELALDLTPGLPPAQADPGQIEQVLLNLCINARDAMPRGGCITIAVGRGRPGTLRLVVSDTGAGVPAELRDRVFDPFYTTKAPGLGTGLGLATVHAILTAHGGGVRIEDGPGPGAHVAVTLPVAAVQAVASPTPPPTSLVPPPASGVVLLAEDDEQVRSMTVEVLEKAGYRVIAAEDGERALALFDERPGEVDLVILDVVMPKCGGPDTFEALRRRRGGLPVLFLTGYVGEDLSPLLTRDDLVALLDKPVLSKVLLGRVRALVAAGREARAVEEPP